MKKYFCTLSFLLMTGSLLAQVHHPEFWLGVKWYVNDQPGMNKTIAFGYDPIASDSLAQKGKDKRDSAWLDDIFIGGEQLAPPPSFDDDVRFTGQTINRGYLESGAYIDIRRKPNNSSFTLQFEIFITVQSSTNSLSLIWDKSKIPAIINHIILEPATISPGPARKKTDMKEVSQLDLPNRDSIGKYRFILVTLYYNQEMGVNDASNLTEGLSLTVYPNPMQERSTVAIQTSRSANLQMEVYDPLGRKIMGRSVKGIAGENLLELNRSEFPAAGTYYVRITTGGRAITKAFQVF